MSQFAMLSWKPTMIFNLLRSRPYQCLGQTRLISYEKLNNKKITRLESDIELNEKRRLLNRNPRNLEMMSYELKPSGFWLERDPPSHRLRLNFEQSGDYLYSYIQHWSGKKILEASTKQSTVSKYINGTNTIQAAIVLGRVISHLSLRSGYMYVGINDDESKGAKTKAFYEAVRAGGLVLEEPPEIQPRRVTDL